MVDDGGACAAYRILDISLGGARLVGTPPAQPGAPVTIGLGPWRMPATIVRADAGSFAVGFAATDETRTNLIRFVYSGRYSADVPPAICDLDIFIGHLRHAVNAFRVAGFPSPGMNEHQSLAHGDAAGADFGSCRRLRLFGGVGGRAKVLGDFRGGSDRQDPRTDWAADLRNPGDPSGRRFRREPWRPARSRYYYLLLICRNRRSPAGPESSAFPSHSPHCRFS